jgi:Uncharacterised nucleotidyltransferase
MFSPELRLLILSIQVVLLNTKHKEFKRLATTPTLNWEKIDKLLKYHRITPVLFAACRQVGFTHPFVETMGNYAKRQSIKNLNEAHESGRVLALLKQNNIVALPYKGLLFLEKMYQNRAIREIGDLDILVKPEDAVVALKVLIADGYKLVIDGEPTDAFLEKIIARVANREVGLDKISPLGLGVHIDFHWHINEAPQYVFDLNTLFEETSLESFQGHLLTIPNRQTIFKMLLNHHGGRDCWVRLKDLTDFLALKLAYPDFDFEQKKTLAKEMCMQRLFIHGQYLLDTIMLGRDWANKEEIDKSSIKSILSMWEKAEHWDKIWPKIALLKIYKNLQDKKENWGTFINQQIGYHAKAGPAESPRLVILPDRFVYLNAFIKLLSYIKRTYLSAK